MQFVFDLDGTICFKGQPLTSEIVQALETSIAEGHEVIFASARPIRDLLPVLPKQMHDFTMVGGNGAFVRKDGHTKVSYFDKQTLHVLRGLIDQYSLPYLADSTWDYAYTGSVEHPIYLNIDPNKTATLRPLDELGEVVKLVLFTNKEPIVQQVLPLPVKVHIHHGEALIDISPNHVDKWTGLKKLGLKVNDYIAFGNDTNDIEMFKHAKESVCVGDHEEAQSYADLSISAQDVVPMILSMSSKYRMVKKK